LIDFIISRLGSVKKCPEVSPSLHMTHQAEMSSVISIMLILICYLQSTMNVYDLLSIIIMTPVNTHDES